jgi:hypothetical protein
MGIPVVDELGRDLERAWQTADYGLAAFPDLCGEMLGAARLHERLDPDDVVRAVFEGRLPEQSDLEARFGQPPVTLFRGARFHVSALHWVDGTTSIHDHAFSGAFVVLSGSSIETTFRFETARDVDGHLRLGALGVLGSGLRRPGEVRPFASGPGYIHSLFHLQRPTISLVVRTDVPRGAGVQLEYSPAGVAHDPFFREQRRDRTVQMVDMLRRTEHPRFEALVGDLIAGADLDTAFSVLRACARFPDGDRVERLVGRVRDADAAARLGAWLAHRRRIDFLLGRRALVHDADLRFLLAVLLNAQRRADALDLVAAYGPGVEPARQAAAWLRLLAGTTMKLQVGGTPFEPNVLGLPPFTDAGEQALGDLLAGRERTLTAEERAFLDRLRALPPLAALFS